MSIIIEGATLTGCTVDYYCDQYYSNVVLLLLGQSTTTDYSSYNDTTGVAYGNVQVSTSQFKFPPSSILYDGTDDRVQFQDAARFNLSQSNFTIETWIRPTAITTTHWIASQWETTAGSDNNSAFYIFLNSNGSIRGAVVYGITQPVCNSAPGSIVVNTWYHIAFVRSGAVVTLFLNGVSVASQTIGASTTINNSNLPVIIGRRYNTGSSEFVGYIDGFRMTVGVARYTSNFTPPTQPFPTVAC